MEKKKIGVLGSGIVGRVLAAGFMKYGYEVMIGTEHPEKLDEWVEDLSGPVKIRGFLETAKFGETVVLAVKGTAAEKITGLVKDFLENKTMIDAVNPIKDEPPQNGILKFFTSLDESLMERLQRMAPKARFVKAFSCVGNAFMVNPDFGGVKPTMFVCGNHAAAKQEVCQILDQFGWEAEDMGGVEGARAIEPLCMLWCIPGLLRNKWTHAFKLLKINP